MFNPLTKITKSLSFCLLLTLQFSFPVITKAEELPSTPSLSLCRSNLEEEINAIIQQTELRRSRWGILIQTLNSQETIYGLEPESYFLPASNAKLFTTAAALLKFGSQWQISTPVYATGTAPHLTSLYVVGRGDPSITTTQLEALVEELKAKGITKIDRLIVEDSYFPEGGINPTWEWEDLHYYWGTSVNSLILNENAVILTILPTELGETVKLQWSDSLAAKQWQIENKAVTAAEETPYNVTIHPNFTQPLLEIEGELAIDSKPDIWALSVPDPGRYFLNSFRRQLLQAGIEVSSAKLIKNESNHWETELTAIESPALAELLDKTNQESNNLYAESLFQLVGGAEGVKEVLTELGVDPGTYHLADGSGLSRRHLISPEAIVSTLSLMAATAEAEIYRASLPIAGESGTLKSRFLNTTVAGNLRAKTGTLTGVSALSGYLEIPGQEPLVLSILVNQSEQSVRNLRKAIDNFVVLLSRLNSNC